MTDFKPYRGPALWLRLRHRFNARVNEWMLSLITLGWGLTLFSPVLLFERPAFSVFRTTFGHEYTLGSIMVFLGLLRLAGLFINGARRRVTPWIRVASAFAGAGVWFLISTSFALSSTFSTWIAVYPAFVVFELINAYRAAQDAGESHALP